VTETTAPIFTVSAARAGSAAETASTKAASMRQAIGRAPLHRCGVELGGK